MAREYVLANKKSLKYKFRTNSGIGSLDAESDRFLKSAFVTREDYRLLLDTSSSQCVILGRTGSGKSALLNKIYEHEGIETIRISPEALSLKFLSNSTILNYFRDLRVHLDLFYKLLWKHVFIVELLQLKFKNVAETRNVIQRLIERFKKTDPRKVRALNYLNEFKDRFWEQTELRIKEIETELINKFIESISSSSEINVAPIKALLTSGATSEELSRENVKSEVVHKAQSVVNSMQANEIFQMVEILKDDIFDDEQKHYFIVIDDLDKEWVDRSIVYDLLRALLQTIKDLRGISGTKIIIALRENLARMVFSDNNSRGIQREKYEDLYLDLRWTAEELRDLVDRRLAELMKSAYTNDVPTSFDILPSGKKNRPDGFTYMLERTFLRPRDIIDYFNRCIRLADGQTELTQQTLSDAELEYSRSRLHAVEDEWRENYGSLPELYAFLEGAPVPFHLQDMVDKATEHFYQQSISPNFEIPNKELAAALAGFRSDANVIPLLKGVLVALYEVGIIQIRAAHNDPIASCFTSSIRIPAESLTDHSRFYVHPTFYRALRISPKPT